MSEHAHIVTKITDAKVAKVADIKQKLEAAGSIVIIDYKGLTVAEDNDLRKAFRANGVKYEVMKNRYVNLALTEMGYPMFKDVLNGPTAVAMSSEDVAAPARVVIEKQRAFKKITFKCGLLDGTYLDEEGCKALSTMPNRMQLLSMLVGLLQAPIAGLARAVNAIAEKKAE